LLSDDEAEGPHYFVDGHLGARTVLVARPSDRLADILLVHPTVEDPDLRKSAIRCLPDGCLRGDVKVLSTHGDKHLGPSSGDVLKAETHLFGWLRTQCSDPVLVRGADGVSNVGEGGHVDQ
jgi:hypothetical protein